MQIQKSSLSQIIYKFIFNKLNRYKKLRHAFKYLHKNFIILYKYLYFYLMINSCVIVIMEKSQNSPKYVTS